MLKIFNRALFLANDDTNQKGSNSTYTLILYALYLQFELAKRLSRP